MTVIVRARLKLNPTGLIVRRGQIVRVTAEGRWTDWTVPTDADGFSKPYLKPSEGLRRVPRAPWFRLCGAVGEDETALFALGRRAETPAPASGALYLFANDVPFMYWNNKGELSVEVELADGS